MFLFVNVHDFIIVMPFIFPTDLKVNCAVNMQFPMYAC